MLKNNQTLWFITGSQHLYGAETLAQVARNSATVVAGINEQGSLPVKLVAQPVVTTPDEILSVCQRANTDADCIGVVVWMHTFSPAKMWIRGLTVLTRPLCHLHTQFNAEIPWGTIDMDFMNLNQSAHGDREFGFMMSRMRKKRKVIVGHWQSPVILQKLNVWARVARGWAELQRLRVARIGDNMRQVAVTEGNKVSAEMRFGFSVNGYAVSDVLAHRSAATESAVQQLVEEYEATYRLTDALRAGGQQRESLLEAARIELTLKSFLEAGGFGAFTDTFENLGEFTQLPGLAVQRLMQQGYGFGAEGDWKTAALLRCMKVMAEGLDGGTSFMEDYTYHFTPERSYVLGSHMLEICPSIAAGKPSCEIHPLGIGGKSDPVRLVFDGRAGKALNASLIDMGNRFRLLVNEVESVKPTEALPNLPVARVLWDPQPNLDVAATAWILAGGAHHTVYTQALTTEYLEDLADIAGIELAVIDDRTRVREFKDHLNANEAYYHLFQHGY
ncbi:L-arabinose isomerase [Lewinella marina]|uniref:L-arabinose isomerase n=1 Tax=Neolewinella marina TaxID=438751 RepID=A0A2G0CB08_9BACT|nr:L-arabinose isomerase [Neolewinella marina]NJB84274.1 L-arabinose isomerase [Neolewinella marina]PHK97142.1 L-arabinose isomerase [Neolewinella marina]